eukprot:gene10946-19781_t
MEEAIHATLLFLVLITVANCHFIVPVQKGINGTNCGELPVPPENSKIVKAVNGSYKVLCNEGFYRVGYPKLVCNNVNGEWKVSAICRKKACGHPGEPKNGKITVGSYQVNATISYYCDECFYLDGPKDRKCLSNETWSEELPVCRPIDCGHVVKDWVFENGDVHGQDSYCGSYILFNCKEGFELQGDHKIVCQTDGKWSGKVPVCVEAEVEKRPPMTSESGKCYGPNYPENGYISKTFPEEVYNPGHIIVFHCLSPYEIIGNPKLVCLENGSWSHKPPTCKLAFCRESKAKKPDGGKVIGGNRIGNVRAFSCDEDRQLIGPSWIQCQENGEWSAKPPVCKPYCDDKSCDLGTKCVYDVPRAETKCVCKEPLDCTSIFEPLCGSNGGTYNNKCLMKADSCRRNITIDVVAEGFCRPAFALLHFFGLKEVLGYTILEYDWDQSKTETRSCEFQTVGGCHRSGWNGFGTLESCEQACIDSPKHGPLCKRPQETGPCTAFHTRWYHDHTDGQCKQFKYGGCFGNENNFASKEECLDICSFSKTTEAAVTDSKMKRTSEDITKSPPTETPMTGSEVERTDAETKILPPSELPPLCTPCDQADLCTSIEKSDFAYVGKRVKEDKEMFVFKVTSVIKDLKKISTRKTDVAVKKVPSDSGCFCSASKIKGSIVITGNYREFESDSVELVMTNNDYFGKYYGPKQLKCQ